MCIVVLFFCLLILIILKNIREIKKKKKRTRSVGGRGLVSWSLEVAQLVVPSTKTRNLYSKNVPF